MSWVKDVAEIVKENNIVEKVSNAVSTIASKLGVAAEHVYTVFAKQVVYESISRIIIYVSLLGIIGVFTMLGKHWYKDAIVNNHEVNGPGVGLIISCVLAGLLTFIFLIYFFSTITDVVTGIANPEYRVIHEIAEIIKEQTPQQAPR